MSPQRFEIADLATVLSPGGRTLVMGCSGESLLLNDAVMRAGPALGAMIFTGIFVPGLNTRTWLANADCRVETFFVTPELKAAGDAVTFLPLCYDDIRRRLSSVPIDAALFMATPADAEGNCSFGPVVDFLAELWPRIPVRIAHLNPSMPCTRGHAGIPFDALTGFIEAPQPLLGSPEAASEPVADAIARHIATLVYDGATLQVGLGKIPGAVLRALAGHRNLRIWSGLVGDAVVDLAEAGALASGAAITAGVAIGSERLYAAISRPAYDFQPVAVTHDARRIAAIPNFVAINSAIEVDLFGQAYSECGGNGLMSGPGGATDFARGARIGSGLRIVALPALAARGTISRIVLPGGGMGPVSLGRTDIDIVVTEFGVADLRDRDHAARAEALVAIAGPEHRDHLGTGWRDYARRL